MFIYKFHGFGQLFRVSLRFFSIFNCNLNREAMVKQGLSDLALTLRTRFVNTEIGVSSRMMS
jgi:hypothetical protein